MKNIKILTIFLSFAILSSCQKVIEVKIDQGTTQLSVDGEVTDQFGPYTIMLTKTQNYFNNNPALGLKGAIVIINDSDGIVDTLKEVSDGKYQTNKLLGKIGNKYNLYIKSAEFGEYNAQTEIRRAFKFDTIYSKYEEDDFSLQKKMQYNVRYSYTDNKGIGDAVRVKVSINDTLQNKPRDLEFHSDENVDGNQIKDVRANRDALKVNYKVTIRLLSITHDYFQFLTELEKQINNGGLFSNPPANVRTNIINKDPNGRKATGYFSGASIKIKDVVVTK